VHSLTSAVILVIPFNKNTRTQKKDESRVSTLTKIVRKKRKETNPKPVLEKNKKRKKH